MFARGFVGAVIDDGVRDLPLERNGFPVYATGVVPSTSVSHYRFAGVNIPLEVDGTHVEANDIIVADLCHERGNGDTDSCPRSR